MWNKADTERKILHDIIGRIWEREKERKRWGKKGLKYTEVENKTVVTTGVWRKGNWRDLAQKVQSSKYEEWTSLESSWTTRGPKVTKLYCIKNLNKLNK